MKVIQMTFLISIQRKMKQKQIIPILQIIQTILIFLNLPLHQQIRMVKQIKLQITIIPRLIQMTFLPLCQLMIIQKIIPIISIINNQIFLISVSKIIQIPIRKVSIL